MSPIVGARLRAIRYGTLPLRFVQIETLRMSHLDFGDTHLDYGIRAQARSHIRPV